MKLLYSNILPLGTDEGQKTITETFNEYFQQADCVEIAVGYVSRASLEELDALVEHYQTQRINLIIGMYYIEGMPEGSYHTAIKINKRWNEAGIGEIRIVRSLKYHVSAMAHGSKLDFAIFQEFSNDWEGLSYQAQLIKAKMKGLAAEDILEMDDLPLLPEGLTHDQVIKARVGQYFFRLSVLTAYNNQCCITGLQFPKLLVASHIKPWAKSDEKTERTNPSNGIALNPFHDKAFDKGFMTIDKNFQVVISSQLKEVPMDKGTRQWFMSYEHQRIHMPDKFLPGKSFIEFHNDVIFLGV